MYKSATPLKSKNVTAAGKQKTTILWNMYLMARKGLNKNGRKNGSWPMLIV
jgi:hypothetical protein